MTCDTTNSKEEWYTTIQVPWKIKEIGSKFDSIVLNCMAEWKKWCRVLLSREYNKGQNKYLPFLINKT